MATGKPNQFVVDLGDVHLPESVSKQLEHAIRRAVLATLAESGVEGRIGIRYPPGLKGIVADLESFRFG
jgi:hypothetical protein